MVPSSNCAVPKSHVTVLLSRLVVQFLFSHKWWFYCHIRQYQHHIWQYFSHSWYFNFFSHIWRYRPHIMQCKHHMRLYFYHIWCSPYFFITFHGSIVTLASTNIILDHIFLTLSGTFETFNGSLFLFSPITIILSKPKKWPKYP